MNFREDAAPVAHGRGVFLHSAGTAVRFEPGDTREVELVAIGGTREVVGLNQLVEGPLDEEQVKVAALKTVADFSR